MGNLYDNNRITLDLSIHRIVNVYCVEGDENSRRIIITLTNNGQPFEIDQSMYISYKVRKPDGNIIHNPITDIIDGKIYIDLDEQCTAKAGIAYASLQLIEIDENLNQSMHSMSFNIIIRESVVSNKEIESTSEFKTLTECIAKAEKSFEVAEDLQDKLDSHYFVLTDDKNVAGGVAGLDESGKISPSQLPSTNVFSNVKVGTTTITADTTTDTLELVAGNNVALTPDATNDKITISSSHETISKATDTTSTASPSAGGTFTAIDSITKDSNGHVTKFNTKTVTLPTTSVTVDSALNSTSTNPVQNKVITEEIEALKTIEMLTLTDELETEWKAIPNSNSFGGIYALGYGNGRFVAHVTNHAFYYSDDGFTWNFGMTGGTKIESIVYGNDMFVAVEDSYIWHSYDGITWTNTRYGDVSFSDVAYGNGKFVAVGNGVMYYSTYSTNGLTWTQVKPYADSYTAGNLNSVAYNENDGNFYAVSADSKYNVRTQYCDIYYPTETDFLYNITYGNGVLVAKDYAGQMRYGSVLYWDYNISGWTKATTSTYTFQNTDIIFGNGIFLIPFTDDGVWLKSSNGINWQEVSVSYDKSYPNAGATTYGDGKFISNGYNENGNSCLVYLSFKQEVTELDTDTVILETKEKADVALQKADTALQKENISNSTAITEKGQYALDAIEKNASVEGTLANQIADVDVPVLIKEFTVSDVVNSAITAFAGQAIRHGRKILIDCSFATTSTGAIWLIGANVLPSASKMYTQLYPHASVTREVAVDGIHHVGIARIQNGGIVVNVTAGEKYVFHLEYVID